MKLQFSAMGDTNRDPAHFCKMIPLNIRGVQSTAWPVLLLMLRLPVSSLQKRLVFAGFFAYTFTPIEYF